MPRFTANIAMMFAERPFLERIDAAAVAGFDMVECHLPFAASIEDFGRRLADAGVALTGINAAAGDAAAGEFGLAALAGRGADFDREWRRALDYAVALGVKKMHVLAGVVAAEERERAIETYVERIDAIAPQAATEGITILLEPLNVRDRPGYLVSRSDEIVALIARIGAPNVKLMFDAYHIQIMEGDLTRRIERHRPAIGHVQVASVPGRHEPDEGEVAIGAIFQALEAVGYTDPIGLEYVPRGRTEDGLGWLAPYRA